MNYPKNHEPKPDEATTGSRNPDGKCSLAKRWKLADHQQRVTFIVDAALQLLHAEDLESVTMRRVAQQLGIGTMTLYTYVEGQVGLHRAMVERGFDTLNQACMAASTLEAEGTWRGGSHAYIQFATTQPNLYKLMFDHPMLPDELEMLHGGFQPLLEKVSNRLRMAGMPENQIETEARKRAGRFWIALHGLATLAIAGRLAVLHGNLDHLIDDLLEHIAPTT
ncbi:MAG: TetR/AcrR family transcriptional regulator [Rhodospirillales bacterium]|nr:TetR/AcrR family transcriptional regulator [Rhodospirillales bacterium]